MLLLCHRAPAARTMTLLRFRTAFIPSTYLPVNPLRDSFSFLSCPAISGRSQGIPFSSIARAV